MKKALSYRNFIFEKRSVDLTEEEFFQGVKENCSQWLKNPFPFIRGKKDGDQFSYTDPQTEKRHFNDQSPASIWYNYIIDNDSKWIGFPKRMNSVIGTQKHNLKGMYGPNYFLVIPVDGWKIAQVMNADDLWQGMDYFDQNFRKLLLVGSFATFLESFVERIYVLRNVPREERNLLDPEIVEEDVMKEFYLQVTEEELLEILRILNLDRFPNDGYYKERFELIYKLIKNSKGPTFGEKFYNLMSDLMDPVKNEIELVQYPDIPENSIPCSEIWTDSACYFYKIPITNPTPLQIKSSMDELLTKIKERK